MKILSWYYAVGAFLAGALIPIQTGYNAQLSGAMNGPMISQLAVYVVGLIAIFATTVALRVPLPTSDQVASAPIATWFAGGILSALYLVALITIAPRLGASTTVASS